uniref:Uncharacterized protein n=1 Tax=Plectus sambesii TaxID=2011161 RepID=A0A914UJH9_9BILA
MSSLLNFMPTRNQATFKPKKRLKQPKQVELLKHASATLGSGNLKDAVVLPPGEDRNEWIAVNSAYYSPTCIVAWIKGRVFT